MRRALLLVVIAIGCGGKVETTGGVTPGAGGSSGHGGSYGGSGGTAGTSAGGSSGAGGSTAGAGGSTAGAAGQGGTTTDPCSLELVQPDAAQNLISTMTSASKRVSAPVAVATPSGFLSIYRESDGSASNLVLQTISDQGAPVSVQVTPTPECSSELSGGISAAWNDVAKKGLAAIAWPACGTQGNGVMFTEFDDQGKTVNSMVPPMVAYEVRFQSPSGAIPTPNDTSFLLAALTDSAGWVPTFYEVSDLNASYAPSFPSITGPSFGVALAGTSQVISFLTAGAKEASWYVAPPNGLFVSTSLPAAKFGRVAATGDRAMAMVVTSEGMPWWVHRADGTEVLNGMIAAPGYPSSLIAAEDHFLVAATGDKSIVVYRFDHASGAMDSAPSAKVTLPQTMGGTNLESFQTEPLSMAAARGKVLVTWINGKGDLSSGAPPGGYALLKCAAP